MSTNEQKLREALRDPVRRRELLVQSILNTQARAGIVLTREQAEMAYDRGMFTIGTYQQQEEK